VVFQHDHKAEPDSIVLLLAGTHVLANCFLSVTKTQRVTVLSVLTCSSQAPAEHMLQGRCVITDQAEGVVLQARLLPTGLLPENKHKMQHMACACPGPTHPTHPLPYVHPRCLWLIPQALLVPPAELAVHVTGYCLCSA
jgi:hypothetical protein